MSNWEDSIRDLKSMQERMNTLLEETRHSEVPDLVEFSAPAWVPAADAFETDREILVLVDLPGVAREDVRVDVDGPHLVVRGERRMPGGARSRQRAADRAALRLVRSELRSSRFGRRRHHHGRAP